MANFLNKPNPLTELPMSTMATPTPSAETLNQPKIEVPTLVKSSDASKITTPNIIDTKPIIANIQSTYDKYGAQAGANEAFVRGALKASGQKETPELIAQYTGKKLGDVISGLGLGEKITGFGINPPTIAPEATKSPISDVKTEKVKTPTARDRIAELDEMANAMSGNIDQAYKDAGVQAYAENVNQLTSELDKLDTSETVRGVMASIDAQDLKDQFAEFEKGLNEAGAETSRNKGIILGQKQDEINQKLQGLSSQQVRDLATYTLNRTNLTQQLQVAQGNYQIASDIAKQSAESMKWAYEQKLNLYKELNLIDQDQKDELTTKNDDDFAKMEKGYVQITPEQQTKYEQDILSGKAEGSIYTDVYGQKWFKPSVASQEEKALVSDMAIKYADAGITLNDSLSTAQSKLKASKIYQDQVRGPVGTSGGGTISGVNVDGWVKLLSTGQATISNVPTNIRNQVISALASSGNNIKKQMSQADITKITDYQAGISALDELRGIVVENSEYIGPISGWQALNPWSEAKKVQANIDKVKQTVGKALEGGVLRKEDEEKYKKILSTITDTPSTATYKLDSLKSSLERDLANYISTIQNAGRYVSGQEQPSALDLEGLRNKYQY